MQLPRPSSILRLIMVALTVVTVPLAVAVLTAVLWVDNLARQSREAVITAEMATKAGRSLLAQVTAMERSARQYLVLGEPALYQSYLDARAELRRAADLLRWLAENGQHVSPELAELSARDESLFVRLESAAPTAEADPEIVSGFGVLSGIAQRILDQSSQQIWSEASAMPQAAARLNQVQLWLAGVSLSVTIGLAVLFVILINRPLRQIDRSIRRLGAGDLDAPIRVEGGPQDLEELGERLEWLRQRLVALEAQKVSFLRHISHELKTPLTAIREGAGLLSEGGASTPLAEQIEIAGIVEASSVRLQKLIEDLLRVSATGAMQPPPRATTVAWDDVVRNVLSQQRLAIAAQGLVVDADLAPVRVQGDTNQLRVVVDNLVSNAVKYSPPGGRVRLCLRACGAEAILEVRDSGPGIPQDERARIFEPFFQGRARPSGPVKGTGLGLALASEYVAAHDGKIECVDETGGGHFRVSLRSGAQRFLRVPSLTSLLLGSVLLAAGCSTAPVAEPPAQTHEDPVLTEMVRYALGLGALSESQRERERGSQEAMHRGGGDALAGLRLAIVLWRSHDSEQDLSRVRRLLDAHLAEPGAPARELAALLRELVIERERAEQDAVRRRVEERAQTAALRGDLARMTEALQHERRRRRALQKQLEALKAIERQINERSTPGAIER